MPKDTFLHLPKQKQEILVKAAREEFSRVPFDEASINRIVKEAQIARGSFYLYFESKEDLYFYLLEDGKKRMEEVFLNCLKKSNGDIVETFISLYEIVLQKKETESDTFFKHMITNTSFKNEKFLKPKIFDDDMLEKMFQAVDQTLFSFEDKQSFIDTVRILQMETIYSLMMYFKEQINKEEAIESHRSRMNLLKYGIYRK